MSVYDPPRFVIRSVRGRYQALVIDSKNPQHYIGTGAVRSSKDDARSDLRELRKRWQKAYGGGES